MNIDELAWNNDRVDHIAEHEVDPEEVWEVCIGNHWARREGKKRFRVYGQTKTGRYLFVVLERMSAGKFMPITARDMTEGEKRQFRRIKK
ncbi:MAG: hypothetical protein HY023_13935 [Chloroflexi bacterium]|nr:hypothetical protein [Chloroflexota bacterium]MBI3761055.1 hypothetical protein [Chloroflexota bacterium]